MGINFWGLADKALRKIRFKKKPCIDLIGEGLFAPFPHVGKYVVVSFWHYSERDDEGAAIHQMLESSSAFYPKL